MRAQRNALRSNALGLPDGIALIRVHLGLAQGACAARIGVSRNTVIAYERGHTMPRAATLRRIAAAGGVAVEALRDGAAPHWLQGVGGGRGANELRSGCIQSDTVDGPSDPL